jgi:RNA polymerase sigma-70 factor (ECF subfamily)
LDCQTPGPGRDHVLVRGSDSRPLTFDELYETHRRDVLRLAYRVLGDFSRAEDVAQEVFLAAWRSGHTFEPARGTVRNWLLAIAYNRSVDALRNRRQLEAPLEEATHATAETDVSIQILVGADRRALDRAMRTLPSEQRQVVGLAYADGLSHGEIAVQLGLPLGTVKGRLRLALQRLRRQMGASQDDDRPGAGTPPGTATRPGNGGSPTPTSPMVAEALSRAER